MRRVTKSAVMVLTDHEILKMSGTKTVKSHVLLLHLPISSRTVCTIHICDIQLLLTGVIPSVLKHYIHLQKLINITYLESTIPTLGMKLVCYDI